MSKRYMDEDVVMDWREYPTPVHYHVCVASSYPAFTCSKLTIETLEQGVKYVKS